MKKSWIALLIAVGVVVVLVTALIVYLRLSISVVLPGII
jgi:hypothetical protein